MFVKICGLSDLPNVGTAVRAGADAVGFVFAPGSPRTVDVATVLEITEHVPERVMKVGVFRKQPIEEVVATARAGGMNAVQLHGGEPLSDFERLKAEGFDTIRALSVDEYLHELEHDPAGLEAHRLLIDAPTPGAGLTFDATPLCTHPPHGPWLLAGGLTPGNVAELIAAVRPAGVDVSSGVENSRGVKDTAHIRHFIAAARRSERASTRESG